MLKNIILIVLYELPILFCLLVALRGKTAVKTMLKNFGTRLQQGMKSLLHHVIPKVCLASIAAVACILGLALVITEGGKNLSDIQRARANTLIAEAHTLQNGDFIIFTSHAIGLVVNNAHGAVSYKERGSSQVLPLLLYPHTSLYIQKFVRSNEEEHERMVALYRQEGSTK